MNCSCRRSTTTVGFNSDDCLVHGEGGLRDLERERRAQWRMEHPIRVFLHRLELRLTMPKMFPTWDSTKPRF